MKYNEEFREKKGDKPEEIRKYEESFKEDNDKPAEIKKSADTNVEEEREILGENPFKEFLSHDVTRDYFDNFFSGIGNLRHGKYDQFLNKKKNNLIKSYTHSNRKK
jgi:hypothetical protein